MSGSVNLRPRGNAYVVTLTFGVASCGLANQTLTGIGICGTNNESLLIMSASSSRTDSAVRFWAKWLPPQ